MKKTLPLSAGLLLSLLALTACHPDRLTIEALDDANHAKIGVLTGSTGEAIAAKRFPEATLMHFDDILDAAAAVKANQLDTFLTAELTANQLVKKNPGLKVLNAPLSFEHLAIGVRKGNSDLLASLNAVLAEMRADGTLASMESRWLQVGTTTYDVPTLTMPTTGKPLRVGVAATREPLIFVDGQGLISGHDAEMVRRIGIKLNRPIEFIDMKFMALIQSLQAEKIDIIGGGMAASDERKKSIDFTDSYTDIHQVLVVPTSASAVETEPTHHKITSSSDLHGRKIAAQIGTAYVLYVTTNYPDATTLQYQSASDVIMAIKSGKAEASLTDVEALKEILKAEPTLAAVGEPVFSFPVGLGFNKDNTALKQQFNDFLKSIRQNGVYADMQKRWLDDQDTQAQPIPAVTGTNALVVGTSVSGLPYVAVKDNELVGFDIELTKRFAASLNRPVQFSNMDFSSLVAAVATKKVDLIADSIFITEERQKKIDFSDSYDEQAVRVFALKSNIAALDGTPDATPAAEKLGYFARVADSFRSNILLEKRYLLIWDGLQTTVIISILATLFGTALGGLICFMRMSASGWLRHPASIYIAILRGTPVLVLLMVIFYIVFASLSISPILVAVIAFGMNFAAYFAEIFRAGMSSLDRGQTEAGIAMGFSQTRTFINIVLPQTIVRILPVYKGEFISLVKMTSIVGYIAVQDLTKASDIIRSRTFDAFFPLMMIAVLYFLISGVLLQALNYLERVTDPKTKRRKAGAV